MGRSTYHPLIDGFKEFCAEAYSQEGLMKSLVKNGQAPDYFVISCIDSRSNPGTIFKALPGQFFAYKAMGAIVRPYTKADPLAASLQFALSYNQTKEIIILGHTGCGAIKALVEELHDDEISNCIKVAQDGLHKAERRCGNVCSHDDLLRYTEEEIVLLSVEHLKSYPSVALAIAENRIVIRPWLFDMTHGDLLEYDEQSGEFVSITADQDTLLMESGSLSPLQDPQQI